MTTLITAAKETKPAATQASVIQVFYDRYFRFVSLVAKKTHMPVSAFQRKAPDFPLTPRAEKNSSLAIHLLFDETEADNTQKCLY